MIIKRVRKFVCLILVAIFLFVCMNSIPVSAQKVSNGNNKCILTSSIPNSVVKYGSECFLSYSRTELLFLGFTNKEIDDLTISYPVTAYEYDAADSPCIISLSYQEVIVLQCLQ